MTLTPHNGTDHDGHVAFGCPVCINKRDEETESMEAQATNKELDEVKKTAESNIQTLKKRLEDLRDAVERLENVVEELPGEDATEELEDALNKERAALAEMTKRRDEALSVNAEAWQKVADLEKRARAAEAERDEVLAMLEGMVK